MPNAAQYNLGILGDHIKIFNRSIDLFKFAFLRITASVEWEMQNYKAGQATLSNWISMIVEFKNGYFPPAGRH